MASKGVLDRHRAGEALIASPLAEPYLRRPVSRGPPTAKTGRRRQDRLLEVQRDRRRRFRARLGYLLMLIGAVGGMITALAAIWEWLA